MYETFMLPALLNSYICLLDKNFNLVYYINHSLVHYFKLMYCMSGRVCFHINVELLQVQIDTVKTPGNFLCHGFTLRCDVSFPPPL
jgi:hypothetical protein